MQVVYYIRTPDGSSVFSAESLIKARELRDRAQQLLGGKMKIIRVTPVEEVIE